MADVKTTETRTVTIPLGEAGPEIRLTLLGGGGALILTRCWPDTPDVLGHGTDGQVVLPGKKLDDLISALGALREES